MKTTVYLYGEMGRRFGRKHRLAVSSTAEALRLIEVNHPGLAAYLIESGDRGVAFRIKVNGTPIEAEQVTFERPGATIRISPVVRGNKDKWIGVVLGIALVALAWASGQPWATNTILSKVGGFALVKGLTVAGFVGGLGLSLAIGGVAQMLSPMPELPSFGQSSDPGRPSYVFQGPVNRVEQGGPVPLCYGGPILVGSGIVSSSVESEDLNATQAAAPDQTGIEGEGSFTTEPDYPTSESSATPTNLSARSLQTKQVARQIHVLCEGEIAGLCDPDGNILSYEERNKGILFDLTPAQNQDGTMAFQEFATAFRPGTASQDWMGGFPSSEAETSVQTQVIKGSDKWTNAVQRQIPAGNHNAVRVTVRIPALFRIDTRGNRSGMGIHMGIQLKRSAESGWREVVGSNVLPNGEIDGLIQGEATEPYVRSYRVPLYGTGPWDIRVGRESDDSPNPLTEVSDLYWDSYTLITDQKLTFRHTAVLGTEISAERFTNPPGVAARIKGLKVKVPSNYNPETRNYTGAWDGEFAGCEIELTSGYTAGAGTITVAALAADLPLNSPIEITVGTTLLRAYTLAAASAGATSLSITPINQSLSSGTIGYGFHLKWTNCPAWIFYDLATHPRYGLGNYIAARNLDKATLYEIGRYCDAVDQNGTYVGVDTGRGDGSKEPRFACNVYIPGAAEAYRVLSDLSSCFRGMVYWGSGLITAVQDSPKAPKFNFTDANVIGGVFNFSSSARKARHTVCYVQFNDPDDYFNPKLEEVPDLDGIEELGVRPITILGFGCTSRGQAKRTGKWKLITEIYEDEICSFRTEIEGARVRPGDICRVSARFRTTNRMYGRLQEVAAGALTLDAPAVIGSGTWTLFVAKQDGTDVELTVTSAAGTHTVLTVTGDLTGVVAGAVFVLRSATIEPALFRILNVKELEKNQFEITALAYLESKFVAVEEGLDIVVPPTSDLPTADKPEPPGAITITESSVDTPSGTQRFLSVSWGASPSGFIKSYLVEYRRPNGPWEVLDNDAIGLAAGPKLITENGEHSFRVYARNVLGRLSRPAQTNYTVADVTNPDPPTGLTATPQVQGIYLQWTNPGSPNLTVAEIQESLNGTFTDPPVAPSPVVGTAAADKSTTSTFLRAGITADYTRHYRVRLRNKSGGKSTWTASVSATANEPVAGADGADGLDGLDGSKVYYLPSSGSPVDPSAGDTWWVTDLGYEYRRFDGTAWVTPPANTAFEIVGGVTYIKKAAIRQVDAGVILAGTITVALTLTAATIDVGSGIDRLYADGNQLRYGDPSFANARMDAITATAVGFFLNNGATIRSAWTYDSFLDQVELDLSSVGRLEIGAISIENGFIQFGNSTNLYSDGTSVLRTDDTLRAAALRTANFEASVTTAVDVLDANFRVYNGATQTARIDYTNGEHYVGGNKVLGARKTGWSTASGTATRSSFDTATVTTPQLAERVKAMIDDLHATAGHGMFGS